MFVFEIDSPEILRLKHLRDQRRKALVKLDGVSREHLLIHRFDCERDRLAAEIDDLNTRLAIAYAELRNPEPLPVGSISFDEGDGEIDVRLLEPEIDTRTDFQTSRRSSTGTRLLN